MNLRFFIFLFCSISSFLASAQTIKIASKKFTESVILGEVISEYLKSKGFSVKHVRELGGTRLVWNALEAGEIDIYVEYSGTLKQEILQTTQGDFDTLKAATHLKGIELLPSLGFNDTYAIGMKKSRAEELKVTKISDLKNLKLTAGLSNEFVQRKDGWGGLKKQYGLESITTRGIDHDIAYKALNEGQSDLTDLYSTDPEIQKYDLVVLEDDQQFFPVYNAHIVVRESVLAQSPGLRLLLEQLTGRISVERMMTMNAAVSLGKKSETSVAQEFLGLNAALASREVLRPVLNFTLEHLLLVILSIIPAILVAIPLGFLAYRRPRLGYWINGVVSVIQTIPALALLVFLIRPLTFLGLPGIGNTPAIITLFLYSLLPILKNTTTGLESIPLSLKNVAKTMGLKGLRKIRLFELPLAIPNILTGIRTALILNIGFATLGALVGAGGLGQPILTGIRLDDYELILSGAVPSALLAVVVQYLFTQAEVYLIPKGLRL